MSAPVVDLDPKSAERDLRALLGDRSLTVLDVTDLSLRRARLETAVEFRVLDRVVRPKPADPPATPRDIAPFFWELRPEIADPFIDEPRWVFEEPLSGCVTTCPSCRGKGDVPCPSCGGTTKVTCDSCKGAGHVQDPKGGTKMCRFCSGEKRQPCRKCPLGEVPCPDCKRAGETYSVQRVTARWHTRKDSRVVAEAPPELPLDGVPFSVERAVRNDAGELTAEHFAELDPPLRAAAVALLTAHPAPADSRVKSQNLVVERVPVFLVRYRTRGGERSVHFVGAPPKPSGLEAPASGATLALVATVLVLGATAALFASGVLTNR